MKLSTLITFLVGLLTVAAFLLLFGGDMARLAACGLVALVGAVLFTLIRMVESCAVTR